MNYKFLTNTYCFLSFILALFLIRLTLPQYVKYILFPGIIIFSLFTIVKFENKIKRHFFLTIVVFSPLILMVLGFIGAFLFTENKQVQLLKDGLNNAFVFIMYVSMLIILNNEVITKKIIDKFQRYAIYSIFLITIFGILKLILSLFNYRFSFLFIDNGFYPVGSSLSIDKNFYALASIIVVIFVIRCLLFKVDFAKRVVYQLFIYLFIVNVFLTTSRRGIFIVFVFLFFLLISYLLSINKKYIVLRTLRKNTMMLIMLLLTSFFLYYYFIFYLHPLERNKWLVTLSFNQYEAATYFNLLTISQKSISEDKFRYDDVDSNLWHTSFDSRFPYSGWAKGKYSLVDKIEGKNSSIVPDSSIAIKVDSKSLKYSEKDSVFYYRSILLISDHLDSLRYVASVYIFISNNFNGDDVYIRSNNTYGYTINNIDLNRRGIWQKVYISFNAYREPFWVEIGVSKKSRKNKGYVLFAYPEIKKFQFDSENPITWAGTNFKPVFPLFGHARDVLPHSTIGCKIDKDCQFKVWRDQIYFSSEFKRCILKEENRYKTTIFAYVSNDFNGTNVRLETKGDFDGKKLYNYDFTKKGKWQELILNNYGHIGEPYSVAAYFDVPNNIKINNLKGYVIFAYPKIEIFDFNSNDPNTYMNTEYNIEYPINGNNSKIVPINAKGCRFDKGSRGHMWNGKFYYFTNEYSSVDVMSGDSVFASVYCYVSDDFNGNQVTLEISGIGKKNTICHYNLREKGKWVKLVSSDVVNETCRVKGLFFFCQNNAINFQNLKGYVTFAYPELVVKSNKICLIKSKKYAEVSANMSSINIIKNNFSDSISGFKIRMPDDEFIGPRIDRWRYAIFLYRKEYSFWQKLIGGGFDYTKKFAKEFNSKNDYDYPHNPFLSVLLYSGIVGLIFYVWFFIKSMYLYYKYRKEYWVLGVAYVITYFFAFFSSNSPFEPGFLGVLSFLPFIIHYVYSKEQIEQCQKEH